MDIAETNRGEQGISKIADIAKDFFTISSAERFISEPFKRSEVTVDSSEKPDDVKIESIIRPNPFELKYNAAELSKGFEIGLNCNANYDTYTENYFDGPKEINRLALKDVIFDVMGKKIRFEEICPETKIVMNDRPNLLGGEYRIEEDTIYMKRLGDIESFLSLLHEAGHAIDFKKRGVSDYLSDKKAVGAGLQERNAWAEALKIIRKNKLPITKAARVYSRGCLRSYSAERPRKKTK